MDSREFAKHAHQLVDWMAEYLDTVEQYPVRSQVKPGDIAAALPAQPPEQGESMDAIFADFKREVLPGMTHWQHPSFFAYFPGNSSPPSVLAEMLIATLAAQCMLWETSPAATEMETRMLEWLGQMTGLPAEFHGVIQDSASSATLCAVLTARERATDWQANAQGLQARQPMAVYTSEEAHSSIEKAVTITGVGRANLRKITSDEQFAMQPAALEAAIEQDKAAGIAPACVIASIGATGTGGVDPLRAIGEICRRQDVFLHVDAAWAGSALILPEHRWMIDGVEYADSLVFNPHKWMLTNFDCSAHFVRDPEALVRTLSILPEYLRTRTTGQAIDYRDWGIPLGRRFRALKLWFVIRSYGVEGLRQVLRNHIAMAEQLAEQIEAADDFELMAPRSLALLCFRYHPAGVDEAESLEALNRKLLDTLNDSGELYLTQTLVRGSYAIRFSIGQTQTDRRHVEAAWGKIRKVTANLT